MLISTIRTADINNSNCLYQQLCISVNSACHTDMQSRLFFPSSMWAQKPVRLTPITSAMLCYVKSSLSKLSPANAAIYRVQAYFACTTTKLDVLPARHIENSTVVVSYSQTICKILKTQLLRRKLFTKLLTLRHLVISNHSI